MPTIEQIYRENLRLLVNEHGGVSALARKLDKDASQVSQWLNASKDFKTGKRRTMSRQMARYVEKACHMDEGWMDQPHGEVPTGDNTGGVFHAPTDAEWEFLNNLRLLPDPEREAYAKQIAERAEVMREFIARHLERAGVTASHPPLTPAVAAKGTARLNKKLIPSEPSAARSRVSKPKGTHSV